VELVLKFRTDTDQARKALRDWREDIAHSAAAIQGSFQRIAGAARSAGDAMQSAGRTLSASLTLPLAALGAAAVKSAKDIDQQVNTLKAFTGSAAAAEARLKQLVATAQQTPGLTTSLAATLDAQLRVANVTVQTIDRILPAIGRLNAVSTLGDPQKFASNLSQLVTQNFEKQDLTELVGQSPIAGQLIKQIFNVDSPTNAKAIRAAAARMGLTTTDAFFTAFADAASKNQALANVTESLGTRIEKMVDRVTVALRPLGLAIVSAVEPYVEPVVKLIERLSEAFSSLSAPARLAVIAIGGIAAVAGPLLFVVGSIISTVGTLAGVLSGPAAIVFAALAIVFAQVAAAAGVLYLAWQTNFGGIRDFTLEVFAAVKEAVSAALAFVGELWQRHGAEILGAALTVWNGVRAVVEGAVKAVVDFARENFQVLVAWVRENWPLIKQTIETVLDGLIKSVRAALQFIQDFWTAHGEKITAAVSGAWQIVKATVGGALQVMLGTVRVALQVLNADWRGAWETLAANGRAVNRAVEVVTSIIVAGLRAVGRMAFELSIEVGKQIVLGILQGIARMNPQTAIAAALIAAISGAGAEARAEAGLQGDALAREMFARFNRAASGAQGSASATGLLAGNILAGARGLERAAGAGGGAGKGKGKGRGKKDDAARFEREELERDAREAEAVHRNETERIEREYEQRATSLREFTNAQIEELGKWYNAQAALITREEELVNRTVKDARERDSKLADLAQKRRDLDDEMGRRSAAVNDAARQKELEAEEAHQRAIEELEDTRGERRIENLKAQAEAGLMARSEAERQIQEIQDAAYQRELNALDRELEAARKNLEERARITDEIIALNERRAASAEAASIRVAEAILKEHGPRPELTSPAPTDGPRVTGTDAEIFGDLGPPPNLDPHLSAIQVFAEAARGLFSGVAQGFGSMIQAFLSGGDLSGRAFLKMAKSVIAGIAAQSIVKGIYETAEGFAALAKPWTAWQAPFHFTAAKWFFAVGGVAAGLALAIPGGGKGGAEGSGAQGNGQGAGNFAAGEGRERRYLYNGDEVDAASGDGGAGGRRGGTVFDRMAEIVREFRETARQERALIVAAVERNTRALSTFETASPEDVVVRGAGGYSARAVIGKAIIEHQDENQGFTNAFLINARVT
jgi:hypothetical protein